METVQFDYFEFDNYQPRFGHTICLIAPKTIVLFGGAVGDTSKYTLTGDVFIAYLNTQIWKRIKVSGNIPTNRAAHQALKIELNQMIIFGGAVGGGELADDQLFLFELHEDFIGIVYLFLNSILIIYIILVFSFNQSISLIKIQINQKSYNTWVTVPVIGTTPGRRYGHTMVLIKPYLIVFGGNTGQEPVNDVWTFNLEKSPYQWQKLDCTSELPNARVYHSAAFCNAGSANGMMVIFGGRTNDLTALNDTWGLRRHKDGRWDWVKAPYKNQNYIPEPRYQHSSIFIGTLMLVIGGRSNLVQDFIPFEIYDTETSDWYKFQSIMRFRHSSWIDKHYLYLHGGFNSDQPNIPTQEILKLDLNKLFAQTPQLIWQLNTLRNDTLIILIQIYIQRSIEIILDFFIKQIIKFIIQIILSKIQVNLKYFRQ